MRQGDQGTKGGLQLVVSERPAEAADKSRMRGQTASSVRTIVKTKVCRSPLSTRLLDNVNMGGVETSSRGPVSKLCHSN